MLTPSFTAVFRVNSPGCTTRLAAHLGAVLNQGDVVLLEGPVGAGKTHFARSLIQSLQDVPEDVPSPTYTLVQVYDTRGPQIWHADLYRLGTSDEIEELGLSEAFETAICLVEWPERLGARAPDTALKVTLTPDTDNETSRKVSFSGPQTHWKDKLQKMDRVWKSDAFLDASGWNGVERKILAGDASNRRYDRLKDPETGGSTVLMDAPPEKGEDIRPFVKVAEFLTGEGLSAPDILAADEENGFLLLEDLGDDLYARILQDDPTKEHELYTVATDLLAALHRSKPPNLEQYDGALMLDLASLAYEKYRGPITGTEPDRLIAFRDAFSTILENHIHGPGVIILRDYHAENLLWLPNRKGISRVGLLDFQDAMIGHPAYDLVSLLQDARRDVPQQIQSQMLAHYIDVTGVDPDPFKSAYAVLGVQRNLRILGVFGRLCTDYGKPGYVDLIPRVWGHLLSCLKHPALQPVAGMLQADLPEPTPDTLKRLKDICPTR